MIMRLLASCAVILLFALPARAFEMPEGYEKIGAFSGEYNGNRMELGSASNADTEFSDLHFVAYADQNQRWVKSFTVQATNGIDADGDPLPELFSVEFDQNPKTNVLEVARVILVDETWDTPLVADLKSGYGAIRIQNLAFDGDGTIGFDVSATLVRLDFEQYNPIPNEASVHIEGHYSGKFPAFALVYPYIAGDY
jgi:hypothetical protein